MIVPIMRVRLHVLRFTTIGVQGIRRFKAYLVQDGMHFLRPTSAWMSTAGNSVISPKSGLPNLIPHRTRAFIPLRALCLQQSH